MEELIERNDASITGTDKYLLTDCGKKLLEVLINPEHTGKSVTEKCRVAGICRDTYYKLIKEDGFIDIINEASIDMIKSHVNDILTATLKYSLKDPKCHSDRRMLLQKCGIIDTEIDSNKIMIINVSNE